MAPELARRETHGCRLGTAGSGAGTNPPTETTGRWPGQTARPGPARVTNALRLSTTGAGAPSVICTRFAATGSVACRTAPLADARGRTYAGRPPDSVPPRTSHRLSVGLEEGPGTGAPRTPLISAQLRMSAGRRFRACLHFRWQRAMVEPDRAQGPGKGVVLASPSLDLVVHQRQLATVFNLHAMVSNRGSACDPVSIATRPEFGDRHRPTRPATPAWQAFGPHSLDVPKHASVAVRTRRSFLLPRRV